MVLPMTTLRNEITIAATVESVHDVIADVGALASYDPTVMSSEVTSAVPTGVGASRKVSMADGRHWFTERMTTCEPAGSIAFELTECNFPIKALRHSYDFESEAGQTKVTQVMEYEVKYGMFGKAMDAIALRRQFDAGVKKFLLGLKHHVEQAR